MTSRRARRPHPPRREAHDPGPGQPVGDRPGRQGRPDPDRRLRRAGPDALPRPADDGHRPGRPAGDPRPERLAPAPDPRRAELQHGAALGRRAVAWPTPCGCSGSRPAARRRRSGCASSAAGASSSSPSGGCRRWRRSTPPRPTRRSSSCTSTTGRILNAAALRAVRLHEGHARPARRRDPAGQAGQPDRPAHRPAERDDPLRDAGEGAEAAARGPGELDPPLHARAEPARRHERHRRRRRLPELPRRLPGHRGAAPPRRDDRPHRLQPVHAAAQAASSTTSRRGSG